MNYIKQFLFEGVLLDLQKKSEEKAKKKKETEDKIAAFRNRVLDKEGTKQALMNVGNKKGLSELIDQFKKTPSMLTECYIFYEFSSLSRLQKEKILQSKILNDLIDLQNQSNPQLGLNLFKKMFNKLNINDSGFVFNNVGDTDLDNLINNDKLRSTYFR